MRKGRRNVWDWKYVLYTKVPPFPAGYKFFLNFSKTKLLSSQIIVFGFDIFNTKSYNLTNQLRDESYDKKEKQELLLLLP